MNTSTERRPELYDPEVSNTLPTYLRMNVFLLTMRSSNRSRDSSVGTATGYGLEDRGSEFEPRYGQAFSLLHVFQTGSEAHLTSYPMGPGVKRPGREADH
jgi:hypothetical protein